MTKKEKYLKSLTELQFLTQKTELSSEGMLMKHEKESQDHDQRRKKNMQEAQWDILTTWSGNWAESRQEIEIDAVERKQKSLKSTTQWKRNKKNRLNKVQVEVHRGYNLLKSFTHRKEKELRTENFQKNQVEP